jgi:hypothetical protein
LAFFDAATSHSKKKRTGVFTGPLFLVAMGPYSVSKSFVSGREAADSSAALQGEATTTWVA